MFFIVSMGKSYDKDYILKEKRYYLLHKCNQHACVN